LDRCKCGVFGRLPTPILVCTLYSQTNPEFWGVIGVGVHIHVFHDFIVLAVPSSFLEVFTSMNPNQKALLKKEAT
jgi:hypothetical protein